MRKDPLTKRARSLRQEKRVAELFGGRVNPGSGCLPVLELKGDVRKQDVLIECKYTQAASESLKLSVLQKARREAQAIKKKYWVDVEFQGETPDEVKGAYVVIDRDDFAEIYESYDQNVNPVLSAEGLLVQLKRQLDKTMREELAVAINRSTFDSKTQRQLTEVLG